jgi:hypothetical protein
MSEIVRRAVCHHRGSHKPPAELGRGCSRAASALLFALGLFERILSRRALLPTYGFTYPTLTLLRTVLCFSPFTRQDRRSCKYADGNAAENDRSHRPAILFHQPASAHPLI